MWSPRSQLESWKQLVEGVRFIEKMNANPVDKDAMAREMSPMRSLFTKSAVAKEDLYAGTILQEDHLAFKKSRARASLPIADPS